MSDETSGSGDDWGFDKCFSTIQSICDKLEGQLKDDGEWLVLISQALVAQSIVKKVRGSQGGNPADVAKQALLEFDGDNNQQSFEDIIQKSRGILANHANSLNQEIQQDRRQLLDDAVFQITGKVAELQLDALKAQQAGDPVTTPGLIATLSKNKLVIAVVALFMVIVGVVVSFFGYLTYLIFTIPGAFETLSDLISAN